MDWNILFSSVAQTSAALLGVVLAFIISRILNESADFDNIDKETNETMTIVKELKIRSKQLNIQWHDEMIFKYDSDFDILFSRHAFDNKTDNEIKNIIKENITRIYSPSSILHIVKAKNEENELKEREKQRNKNGFFPVYNIEIPIITPEGLWRNINDFEDSFRDFEIRSAITIKKVLNMKKAIICNINDFSILKKIILAFLPIIFITIVYPLHFLPIPENQTPEISFDILNAISVLFSIGGFFVTIIFLISLGIVLFFWKICKDHQKKYDTLLATFTEDIINIKSYNEFFNIQEI